MLLLMYDPVINWPGNFKLSKFLLLFYTETGYSCPWIWTAISGFIWISFSNLYKSESNKYCLILYDPLRIHCSMLFNSLKNDDDFYCFLKKDISSFSPDCSKRFRYYSFSSRQWRTNELP